ncbi:EKA-like protein [Blumeria hordei DH14]|uniref:EKA-like protein n=1 Tax=Blumeria graminis f. sp. hordei (strain DH14) TaxID=546991 RepID=N1JQH9_BLUG1|nr:EKA-like protein [Blumeria hordei DH14]
MPPTRKTHKNAISGTAKDRVNKPYKLHESIRIIARQKLTEKGVEVSDQNLDTIEAALEAKGGDIPEVEMLDAEVLKLKSLSESRWASSSPDDAEKASGPAETSRETVIAPEKRATVPAVPRLVEVSSSKGAEIITNKASTAPESVAEKAVPSTTTAEAINASRPKPPPASIPGTAECHNHSSGGAPTGTTPIHPPEIEALLEAERKRAANTSARLEIGSTVLKTLESVILSMKTTDNCHSLSIGTEATLWSEVFYFQSMVNYRLKRIITVTLYMIITPANDTVFYPYIRISSRIPFRIPSRIPSRIPLSAEKSSPPPHRPAGQQQRALTTIDHQDSKSCSRGAPGHFNLGNCSPERATQTADASDDKSCPENADSADQVIGQDAPFWRNLSPAGIREAVAQLTNATQAAIEHVYRVPTGFALRAKNKESRQALLNAAESFLPIGGRLEEASELVALQISTVPVAIHTLLGRAIPVKVRPHGKTRLDAPYKSWLAHFKNGAAPRQRFHLFDNSGVAVPHKPRQTVQQCKRCLQFHGTRGCARAQACWNCTSTMHSTDECRSHIKCRNCGVPHRSDSRVCLARPIKSGPVSREQLANIRIASQRELAAVMRAKAAARRAEATVQAAARQTQDSPTAVKSNNSFEVLMTDVTPDATPTGTTNLVESS